MPGNGLRANRIGFGNMRFLPDRHNALTTAVISHLRILRRVSPNRPIPLSYWSGLRAAVSRVTTAADPLSPPEAVTTSTGEALEIDELRRLLAHDVLGTWSLDAATIDLFWSWMQQHRPRVMIECGAGVSTMVLAAYRAGLPPGAAVLSLEQNASEKTAVDQRLRCAGLGDDVHIIYTPLSPSVQYLIDLQQLSRALASRTADVLLIDGPYGPPGCRVWTLPLLAPFCRAGTTWFLDDALRDGELSVLRAWSRVPGVSVQGIYPVGKGFAIGTITDPQVVSLASVSGAVAAGTSVARRTGSKAQVPA